MDQLSIIRLHSLADRSRYKSLASVQVCLQFWCSVSNGTIRTNDLFFPSKIKKNDLVSIPAVLVQPPRGRVCWSLPCHRGDTGAALFDQPHVVG